MAKYVIDDSTLESLGNAVRLKSGARVDLKPSQMINLINNLPTNASHALQTMLTPLLPNLNLGAMNAEQFIYTINRILTEDSATPNTQRFNINSCTASVSGDGMPFVVLSRSPIQTTGGEITATSVSIPFKVTLDGTTTNYELTKDSDGNPIIQEVE